MQNIIGLDASFKGTFVPTLNEIINGRKYKTIKTELYKKKILEQTWEELLD